LDGYRLPHQVDGAIAALAIAFVGAAILPVGFLIGGLTEIVLKAIFGLRCEHYEIVLGEDSWERIFRYLGATKEHSSKFYAWALFAGETLKDDASDWVERRWSAFMTSANSILVVIVFMLVGPSVFQKASLGWWYSALFLILVVFAFTAVKNWRQVMGMATFQASRVNMETGEMPKRGNAG
jgi:hypothetical protein